MKCPHHDCQKDFNPEWGSSSTDVDATSKSKDGDGIKIVTFQCRFCEKKFHEIYKTKYATAGGYRTNKAVELLFILPFSKTKFEAKSIPAEIKTHFNEAERCRSVGSLTGVGACLRKTVYALCDAQGADGTNYREKIKNLPVAGKYKDLLNQIKWLGDNATKPSEEKYTMEEAELALEILPVILEELYAKDEKLDQVEKLLQKANSKPNTPKK